jgi:arylsulfatase A-like enzyme
VRKDWAGYIESIQVLDAQAGKILKRLEEEGLVENTVVIFMSDTGSSMGASVYRSSSAGWAESAPELSAMIW